MNAEPTPEYVAKILDEILLDRKRPFEFQYQYEDRKITVEILTEGDFRDFLKSAPEDVHMHFFNAFENVGTKEVSQRIIFHPDAWDIMKNICIVCSREDGETFIEALYGELDYVMKHGLCPLCDLTRNPRQLELFEEHKSYTL